MKKKILAIGIIAILIILLVVLTGCGNTKNSNEQQENTNLPKNSLASQVKIGDYVDYKFDNGSITISKEDSGLTSNQVFETTGTEKWRVLNINSDGTVDLISEEVITTKNGQKYASSGVTGYLKHIDTLNKISTIYGNSKYAQSTRHLNLDDVYGIIGWDNIANYYGITYEGESSKEKIYQAMNSRYGSQGTVTNSTKIYYPTLNGGNENGYTTQNEFEVKSDVKADYGDNLRSSTTQSKNLEVYNKEQLAKSLLKDSWIADVFVDYAPVNNPTFETSLVWGVYAINKDTYLYSITYAWNDPMTEGSYKNAGSMNNIRPVVTLKANVESNSGNGTSEQPFTLK